MSYDRRWLEDTGSEDSHGRALWALAECARKDTDASRRRWATALFKTALPVVESFSSPRAWAFAMLGMNAYCAREPADEFASELRKQLAERLLARFLVNERVDWVWFEDVLAYDNARLPQAMIQTGLATQTGSYRGRGFALASMAHVDSDCSAGTFSANRQQELRQLLGKCLKRSISNLSRRLRRFPLALLLFASDGDEEWSEGAKRAFAWFMGENDLGIALIDPDTGSCLDGLHPDRANENKGAESVLSYLLGLQEIRQFKSVATTDHIAPTSRLVPTTGHDINPQAPLGRQLGLAGDARRSGDRAMPAPANFQRS